MENKPDELKQIAAYLARLRAASEALSGDQAAQAHADLAALDEAISALHARLDTLNDAHTALGLQCQEYQALFEFAQDGYLITDLKLAIRRANPAAILQLRLDHPPLNERTLADFVSAGDRRHIEAMVRLLESRQRVEREIQLVPVAGEPFPARLTAAAIQNHEGQVIGLHWQIRDMTDLEQAEQERLYAAAIIENSDDAIVARTLDGIVITWNSGAERTYGYRAEEILGRNLGRLLPPGYEGEHEQVVKRLRSGERLVAFDTKRRRKDGKLIDVSLAASPILDSEGNVRGFSTIARDITARKQVEEQLRYQAYLLQHVSDAIIATDMQMRITSWNTGAETIYGWAASEVIGRLADDVLHTRFQSQADQESVLRQIEQEGYWQGEVLHDKRDGTTIHVLSSTALLLDENDQPAGMVSINRDITEQKWVERIVAQAHTRANQERRRLQTVLAALPVGVFIADASGRVVQTNDEVARIWGGPVPPIASPADFARLIGGWAESGEPIEPEGWALARAVRQGQVVAGEVIDIERSDGTHGTIINSAVPITDEDGTIIGGVLAAMDITERRAAEKRTGLLLQLTAALSKALTAEQIADTMVEQGLNMLGGHVGMVALLEDTGRLRILHRRAELSEIHELPLEQQQSPIADVLKTGQPVWIESAAEYARRYPTMWKLVQPRTGSRSIAGLPLIVNEQVIGGMVLGFAESRTFSPEDRALLLALAQQCSQALERARLYHVEQQARAEAEHERQRVVSILESITDAFIAVDTGWRYAYINHQAEQLLRQPRSALIGQPMDHTFMDAVGRSLRDYAQQAVRDQAKIEYEAYITELDTWFAIRLYPAAEGVSAYLADITERKRSEARELELAVERERIRVLSEFIRTASHDFKTPLSTINASLYLLRRLPEPEKQQHHVSIIERQTARLTRLVEGMLTMTRLDSEAGFVFRPVVLNQIVRDIENRIQGLAEEKQVELALRLAHSLPPVLADEAELGRAILELGQNAVQFTAPGGRVILTTHAETDHAVVEVHDTGSGIAPEDLPHIFQRLYRADKARSVETGGVGLGLSIAQRIVEMHQGRIEVSSTPGQGSIFRVRLPTVPPAGVSAASD